MNRRQLLVGAVAAPAVAATVPVVSEAKTLAELHAEYPLYVVNTDCLVGPCLTASDVDARIAEACKQTADAIRQDWAGA